MMKEERKGFSGVKIPKYETKEFLAQEEIDAIIVILDEIMDCFLDYPNVGSIEVCGQRRGRSCCDIFYMNLVDGPYQKLVSQRLRKTSDDWADESTTAVAYWPEQQEYGYKSEALQFGEMPTGVYANDLLRALVLNTTFGRFVMSFYLAVEKENEKDRRKIDFIEYYDESITAMKILANVLAEMRPEDARLRQSVFDLKLDEKGRVAWCRIKEKLEKLDAPELVTWRKWREEMVEKGRTELYFER